MFNVCWANCTFIPKLEEDEPILMIIKRVAWNHQFVRTGAARTGSRSVGGWNIDMPWQWKWQTCVAPQTWNEASVLPPQGRGNCWYNILVAGCFRFDHDLFGPLWYSGSLSRRIKVWKMLPHPKPQASLSCFFHAGMRLLNAVDCQAKSCWALHPQDGDQC